jgi:hypothetical protein
MILFLMEVTARYGTWAGVAWGRGACASAGRQTGRSGLARGALSVARRAWWSAGARRCGTGAMPWDRAPAPRRTRWASHCSPPFPTRARGGWNPIRCPGQAGRRATRVRVGGEQATRSPCAPGQGSADRVPPGWSALRGVVWGRGQDRVGVGSGCAGTGSVVRGGVGLAGAHAGPQAQGGWPGPRRRRHRRFVACRAARPPNAPGSSIEGRGGVQEGCQWPSRIGQLWPSRI